jgi:N6-L-threonylcarbamoyladenine synthase
MLTLLAIESSCDDTSAAICKDGIIYSNIVASQSVHKLYGGVVPELASRAHLQHIIPTVNNALEEANVTLSDLNAIAFTRGPGLLGSLLVGGCFAKTLAQSLQIPLIEVHHMHAHLLAHFIEEPKPKFPFLCLTVSGGHTQIVLAKNYNDLKIVGDTKDDAAGEAFDKIAKILGLPYPGGPMIDKLAQNGNPSKFTFTIPKVEDLMFSFSGLKTNILYFINNSLKQDENFIKNNLNDLCASIQYTIVKILIDKIKAASRKYNIKNIAIAGGVAANSGLKNELLNASIQNDWQVFIPKQEYCTDNAAMIAIAGYFKLLNKEFVPYTITPVSNLEF